MRKWFYLLKQISAKKKREKKRKREKEKETVDHNKPNLQKGGKKEEGTSWRQIAN